MAEEHNRDEWYEDIDALVPKRAGRLKVEGVLYDARHFADFSNEEAAQMVRLDLEIEAATDLEQLRKLQVQQIRMFCPEMPEATLLDLTIRKRSAIRVRVTRLGEAPSSANPPGAGGGSESSDSSLPSGASTDPPTTS